MNPLVRTYVMIVILQLSIETTHIRSIFIRTIYLIFFIRPFYKKFYKKFYGRDKLSDQDAVVVADHDRGDDRQVEQERGGRGGRRRRSLRDSGWPQASPLTLRERLFLWRRP